MEDIEIIEHQECYPGNAQGGYYVRLQGPPGHLLGDKGWEVAEKLAKDAGFNPKGFNDAGFLNTVNNKISERCYWFHTKLSDNSFSPR